MELHFFEGDHFWKKRTRYKPGPTLTEETVEAVEQIIGKKLPVSYVRYMKEQNGGELTYSSIQFDDGDVASIPYLHEISVDSGVGLSPIFVEAYGFRENIVLLSGDLDSWLALDYRNDKVEPSIIYMESIDDNKWKEHVVASNFETFTKKLFTHRI